jgi:hypothetical protein
VLNVARVSPQKLIKIGKSNFSRKYLDMGTLYYFYSYMIVFKLLLFLELNISLYCIFRESSLKFIVAKKHRKL